MPEFFADFQLLRPWWLLALLPGGILWWLLRRSKDPLRMYSGLIAPHLLQHLIVGDVRKGLLHPARVFPLIWLLLSIALAGPSWRMEPSPFAEQQAGLVILLKTGSSMMAQDLPPTRMKRAIYKIHDLFETRGQEPSALIAYSGSAHLVMPLTRDTRIIELMAGELDPTVMPVDGDRLDEALELAHQQVDRSQSTGSILVIADSIDETLAGPLSEYRKNGGLPVQILVMALDPRVAESAVSKGAQALDARVYTVTVDRRDVQDIAAGAKRMVSSVNAQQEGNRRRDEGYAFVPLLAALIALWARRGWSIRWK